jgi:hypothetical protein
MMNCEEKKPLLSICVPTNNRVDLLMRTLRSVQTSSRDVEIVVTDNSAGDETQRAVEALFEGYEGSWRYHKNNFASDMPGAQKMVGNFNMGVQLAEGKYIYIIHDDDYLLDGAVDVILRRLRELGDSHQVVVFGTQLVDLECNVLKVKYFAEAGYYPPTEAVEILLDNSSSMRFPSFILSREACDAVGEWDIGSYPAIDYNMWVRSFMKYGVRMLPDLLSAYTIHDQCVTMTMFNVASIRPLCDLFDIAKAGGVVEGGRLEELKSKFLRQFILAGAWKYIRSGANDEACEVMQIFDDPEMKQLRPSMKWLSVKLLFSVYLSLARMMPSARSSAKPA